MIEETHGAKVERGIVVEVEAFDWNCSQHITERALLAEIDPTINAPKFRIVEFGAEVGRTRPASRTDEKWKPASVPASTRCG